MTRDRSRWISTRFSWRDTRDVVGALMTVHPLRPDRGGRRLVAGPDPDPDVIVTVPTALPAVAGDVVAWLDHLPGSLGLEAVVLLRAGSAALGVWRDDEPVAEKVFKRYVVRGTGRAQPTHLRVKGKSRYGSRLRLQQAARLLEEVAERLSDWERIEGRFDVVHRACPPRLWVELTALSPGPPFEVRDPRIRRVPVHVHEPGRDELRRVREVITTGSIVRHRRA